MKWIEIIELRLSRKNLRNKLQFLRDSVDEFRIELGNKSVKMYSHTTLESDFLIQLKHNSDRVIQNGSKLGLQFVRTLKEIGLVNHTVWVENDIRDIEDRLIEGKSFLLEDNKK